MSRWNNKKVVIGLLSTLTGGLVILQITDGLIYHLLYTMLVLGMCKRTSICYKEVLVS